jgi:hypothetical protein
MCSDVTRALRRAKVDSGRPPFIAKEQQTSIPCRKPRASGVLLLCLAVSFPPVDWLIDGAPSVPLVQGAVQGYIGLGAVRTSWICIVFRQADVLLQIYRTLYQSTNTTNMSANNLGVSPAEYASVAWSWKSTDHRILVSTARLHPWTSTTRSSVNMARRSATTATLTRGKVSRVSHFSYISIRPKPMLTSSSRERLLLWCTSSSVQSVAKIANTTVIIHSLT